MSGKPMLQISPYGQKAGLKERMAEWVEVLKENRAYVGLIADIEQVVPLLPSNEPSYDL